MRYAAPVSHIPMRYAVTDIRLPDGTPIRQGEAILASFGAASNNPRTHGETAAVFDATRPDKQHVASGYGVHFCLGAPLARAEASIALSRLFDRFPSLRLAVPESDLLPLTSIMGNGHQTLRCCWTWLSRSLSQPASSWLSDDQDPGRWCTDWVTTFSAHPCAMGSRLEGCESLPSGCERSVRRPLSTQRLVWGGFMSIPVPGWCRHG
ncbi:cytochrome P450 [Kribbella sp. NBC_00709]|uniref:cytochrome P450 n=1 Tax=Kribbella sp. NBC_00709 TaxID=2975972 RepID=UPI00324522B8